MQSEAPAEVVKVEPAEMDERTTIAGMMQRYLAETAPYTGQEASGDGRWRYPGLDYYWYDDKLHPFLFRLGRRNIGFALVRQVGEGTMIAEFYVAPAHRHQGHGTTAALALFRQFPGKWAVREPLTHDSAQEFFRSVILKADRSFSERVETTSNGRSYATQGFTVPAPWTAPL